MKNLAKRASLMPTMALLGVLFLSGAIFLLYTAQPSEPAATGNDTEARLQQVRTGLLIAREAFSAGSPDTPEQVRQAVTMIDRLNAQGFTAEQSRAAKNVQSGLETIASNWSAREALIYAGNEVEYLLPQLDDTANTLEELIVIQGKPLVIAQLERMRLLAAGLGNDLDGLIAGSVRVSNVSQKMLDREMAFSQIVRGFRSGDPNLGLLAVTNPDAVAALSELAGVASRISDSVQNVLTVTEQLAALNAVRGQFNALDAALASKPVRAVPSATVPAWQNDAVLILSALGLLMFLIMAGLWYLQRDIRRTADLQIEQTEKNQAAIMRLLDELGSLADGDLTINATVTEDITGAIADSINFAIEALRELVATLNNSAIRVDGAARQTDMTAEQLAEATAEQSKQIEEASQAILQLAASIEEISGNAERSSDVARHSVDVAHKGGEAVRRTIEGMSTIRETIQDTAKRIKRLGESSQEIGNIIELINDIADQTNILALNASIQASMAGEAGRGFAVVADEVQRLAERSANATKQIEVLVRTIQADTNEAVVSMERSTTDVVGGALLAENAGAALEEIEQVSNQIASLVQNISGSARGQSTAAAAVTRSVDRLQDINQRTEASTNATTGSIRELAELAAQLRESVSGFRLPDDDEAVDYEIPETENEGEDPEVDLLLDAEPDEDSKIADSQTV